MPVKKIRPGDLNDFSLFEFMNSGTRDYIAARVLLLNGLSGQGSVLAVTSFEKTLKTILIKFGQSFRADGKGHDLNILIDKIKTSNSTFFSVNEELFLRKINNSYRIRYFISEAENVKIFLPSLKILLNTDKLYCRLIKSAPLANISPGSKLFDMYEKGAMPKNHLLDKNVIYNSSFSSELEENDQWCDKYEHITDGKTFNQKYRPFPGKRISGEWDIPDGF